jgi:superfamily II DNA or RNA helicase
MIVDSIIRVGISELSPGEWKRVEKSLTFMTDDGDIVQSFKRLLFEGVYVMPRGAWYVLPAHVRYKDQRSFPPMPKLKFTLKLDDVSRDPRFAGQSEAVDAMFENEQGLIIRPPGTGKTQIALYFAAKCKTRTLVLVHTEDILQQWVQYAKEAMPDAEVEIWRGRTKRIGHITIATVQTIKNKIGDEKFWQQFGCVIVDEAHHVAASSWEAIMNSCPARYRFGFTASPTRADSWHPAMRHIIGPIIHRQKFTSPVRLEIVPVKTNFKSLYRGSWDWTNLMTRLVRDDGRNQQIAEVVDAEIEKGNSVLVLSRRIEHLEAIAERMHEKSEILTGARRKRERASILHDFKDGTIRCLLATQLADEALDVPRLNRVCLVFPGKHEGRIIQQIGRAIRQHSTKKDAVIFDFIDPRVSVLRRQWNQRRATYKKNKISIKRTGVLAWR